MTLLVLDFPGRRADAPVSDLQLESAGYDCRYLLAEPLPTEPTAKAYAAELRRRWGPQPDATAMLAYCMSAPLAQELAALLVEDGAAPIPLIVFDGGPCTPGIVEHAIRDAFGPFAAALTSPVELDEAMLRADPAGLLAGVRGTLSEVVLRSIADGYDDGEDPSDDVRAIVDHYLDWITHVVAAHASTAPVWGGGVLHVTSKEHPFRGGWPGATVTETVTVDAGRAELLRTDAARLEVLRILATGL